MTSRFISPFYDVGSGIKPPSGAQLEFFATDGVTPKDTFSDQLSVPTANTNPVIADSFGVFGDIYIGGDYKVTLKDKNDVQIFGLAAVSEVATGNFDTNLINDLSQAYTFDTVALFKASLIEFPDGKTIHLNDRGADFQKITGTGTGNDIDILASTSVNQSVQLPDTDELNAIALGGVEGGDFTAALIRAITIGSNSLDLNGLAMDITSNIDYTTSGKTLKNGTLHLVESYFDISAQQDNTIKKVKFLGDRNVEPSEFTGVFQGEFAAAPAVVNGDAYFDSTLNRTFVGRGGLWARLYKLAGVRVNSVAAAKSFRNTFDSCTFENLDCGINKNSDTDSQDGFSLIGKNRFQSNGVGLLLDDPKRCLMNSNTHFIGNDVGLEINTVEYVGLGVDLQGAYFNANIYGLRSKGGLYDSIISNNIIDHNHYFDLVDVDVNIGGGFYFEVGAGRTMRSNVINSNNFRNNSTVAGFASLVFINNGDMTYNNICDNAFWLDTVNNIIIDYSGSVAMSLNNFEGNNAINGITIIDDGVDINVNNSVFSGINGGNIRGKTQFKAGIEHTPRDFIFSTTDGFTQFFEGSGGIGGVPAGMYVVNDSEEDGIQQRQVLTASFYRTVRRPTGAAIGFMTFDNTLGKPIWRGAGGTWVDATGAIV